MTGYWAGAPPVPAMTTAQLCTAIRGLDDGALLFLLGCLDPKARPAHLVRLLALTARYMGDSGTEPARRPVACP